MDAESNLTEKSAVSSNSVPPPSEPVDPVLLKEKVADELKSAATLKGGGDAPDSVPLEKDDLLERLDKIDTGTTEGTKSTTGGTGNSDDVDMENDDLIQRLEAMEKGEQEGSAPTSTELFENKGESNVVDVNHRNGIEAANEMDSGLSDEKIEQPKPEEHMEVDDTKRKMMFPLRKA